MPPSGPKRRTACAQPTSSPATLHPRALPTDSAETGHSLCKSSRHAESATWDVAEDSSATGGDAIGALARLLCIQALAELPHDLTPREESGFEQIGF